MCVAISNALVADDDGVLSTLMIRSSAASCYGFEDAYRAAGATPCLRCEWAARTQPVLLIVC
jgi:hypothetical protein